MDLSVIFHKAFCNAFWDYLIYDEDICTASLLSAHKRQDEVSKQPVMSKNTV